jgi:VWFA-related protein
MSRTRSAAVLVLLSVLSFGGPLPRPSTAQEKPAEPPPSTESPAFPSEVEVVKVDVVVTDKKGGPIPGLSRDAFTVFEDGVPQTITSFEAIQLPDLPSATPPPRPRVSTNNLALGASGRTFAVVFDDVHLTPFQAQRAKGAVAEFLRSGVREGDRVILVATGGGAWWSTRMEAGRDELLALLKRLDGRHIPDTSRERMSDYEAMQIHIFRDQPTEQRVSRRFETYGVTSQSVRRGEGQMYLDGDPLVRGRAAEIYLQAVSRNRITLEVLGRILRSLASAKGRKSLILVSEGFIYDPNLDEFKQVLQASRRSNVALYFLDTRGLGGIPSFQSAEFGPPIDTSDMGAAFMESFEAAQGAEALAVDSGGFSVKNTNDLAKGIKRIVDESRSYYLLGYTSTNTKADGRFRKLEVKTTQKGVQIRARKGYYARLEGGKAPAPKPGQADPAIQAALDSPYEEDGVPLRMTSYVLDETLLGKASVLVATEVDIANLGFEEKDGRFIDTVEFMLVVAHRESGDFYQPDPRKLEMKLLPDTKNRLSKTWVPIVQDFELAPGGYQAKVVVRDKNSGRIGTVIHDFEVGDLSKLRISTPLVSDTLQQNSDGKGGAPRPLVLARRAFAPGSMIYCQFEVYGAAKDQKTGMPRVSAGYVIRGLDGHVIAQVSPTAINPTSLGKLSRLVGAPLKGANPGDYELVLSLTDEIAGKSLEVKETFTVDAAMGG